MLTTANIGERIKAARKNAGLTQKELGDILGVSFQAIAQWETGKRNPKMTTLWRLSEALHIPADYFSPFSPYPQDFKAALQLRQQMSENRECAEYIEKIIEICFGKSEKAVFKKEISAGRHDEDCFLFHTEEKSFFITDSDFQKISDISVSLIRSLVLNFAISEVYLSEDDTKKACDFYSDLANAVLNEDEALAQHNSETSTSDATPPEGKDPAQK